MTTSMAAAHSCAAAQTENIVRQLLERIPRHGGPGNLLRAEISSVVAGCLDLVTDEAMAPSVGMERIHRAAARWAGVGVPIETVHRLVREGFRLHLDTYLGDRQWSPLRRNEIDRLMGAQNAVNVTVARAYLEVVPRTGAARQQHEAARALLGGRRPDRVALEYGMPLTQCYTVLAVAATNARGARAMGTLQDLLAGQCGHPVPALLSGLGGTIVVPGTIADAEEDLRTLLTRMPMTASAVRTDSAAIPAAAETAHELLDVVRRVYGRPGLYPFEDLVVEYQLTRPAPARDSLVGLLDPIAEYPELLQTLRVHISTELNRRLTARTLHIHVNTVDYRLRRIGSLVGLDATRAAGLWRLRAGMIARSYLDGTVIESRPADGMR
ncbi:PucR family transcriptional regulator [Nocardia vermiculata]|uniref:PucR family transcriptional regulator n=1 Tax=Nocardia vermiculata TaxID=257274 RepID=A0A846Y8Q5_9NOCA|nr:helix-turn-helix domain-containing protein [Nocardia vermiculata]NKY53618.1 PucR family transcriptional regulator [Nocardia vermiculata]